MTLRDKIEATYYVRHSEEPLERLVGLLWWRIDNFPLTVEEDKEFMILYREYHRKVWEANQHGRKIEQEQGCEG